MIISIQCLNDDGTIDELDLEASKSSILKLNLSSEIDLIKLRTLIEERIASRLEELRTLERRNSRHIYAK